MGGVVIFTHAHSPQSMF